MSEFLIFLRNYPPMFSQPYIATCLWKKMNFLLPIENWTGHHAADFLVLTNWSGAAICSELCSWQDRRTINFTAVSRKVLWDFDSNIKKKQSFQLLCIYIPFQWNMVAVRVRRLVFLVCMDEILKHAVYSSIFAVVIVSRHAVYSSKDRNTQRNQVISPPFPHSWAQGQRPRSMCNAKLNENTYTDFVMIVLVDFLCPSLPSENSRSWQ